MLLFDPLPRSPLPRSRCPLPFPCYCVTEVGMHAGTVAATAGTYAGTFTFAYAAGSGGGGTYSAGVCTDGIFGT